MEMFGRLVSLGLLVLGLVVGIGSLVVVGVSLVVKGVGLLVGACVLSWVVGVGLLVGG